MEHAVQPKLKMTLTPIELKRFIRNKNAKIAQKLKDLHLTPQQISNVLNVKTSTVYNYLKLDDVDLFEFKPMGRQAVITNDAKEWITKQAMDQVTCSQQELATDASQRFGIPVSQQSVSLILQQNDITRKKLQVQAEEKDLKPWRHVQFHEQLLEVDHSCLGAMDESSFWINDGPRYGYSKKGKPATVKRSRARGTKVTLALCIRMVPEDGSCVVGYAIYPKSMTAERFLHFLQIIRLGLDNNDQNDEEFSIILDNGSFHGPPGSLVNPVRPTSIVSRVQELSNNLKIKLLFMRPLSPEFNPVEYIFSTIKRSVRAKCPKTRADLLKAIKVAILNLNHEAIFNTFGHCIGKSTEEYLRLVGVGADHFSNRRPPINSNTHSILENHKFIDSSSPDLNSIVDASVEKKMTHDNSLPSSSNNPSNPSNLSGNPAGEVWECEVCFKRFHSNEYKCIHKRLHGIYECDECGATYTTSAYLNIHLKDAQNCVKYREKMARQASRPSAPPPSQAAPPTPSYANLTFQRICSSNGVNGAFFPALEKAYNSIESTAQFNSNRSVELVINWDLSFRERFVAGIGLDVVPQIASYLVNVWEMINDQSIAFTPKSTFTSCRNSTTTCMYYF